MTKHTPPAENTRPPGGGRTSRGQFAPGTSGNPSLQFQPGQSANPGGRPKGAGTLLYNVRDLVARAIKGEDTEAEAIKRVQENLRNRRSVMSTLELAARLNREIGIGSEDVMPGVTIIVQTNLQPGALRRRAGAQRLPTTNVRPERRGRNRKDGAA